MESEDTKEKFDYYICPHHESLKTFFEYHPQQISNNPVVQKCSGARMALIEGGLHNTKNVMHCIALSA